jgi:hypothetical protein
VAAIHSSRLPLPRPFIASLARNSRCARIVASVMALSPAAGARGGRDAGAAAAVGADAAAGPAGDCGAALGPQPAGTTAIAMASAKTLRSVIARFYWR